MLLRMYVSLVTGARLSMAQPTLLWNLICFKHARNTTECVNTITTEPLEFSSIEAYRPCCILCYFSLYMCLYVASQFCVFAGILYTCSKS